MKTTKFSGVCALLRSHRTVVGRRPHACHVPSSASAAAVVPGAAASISVWPADEWPSDEGPRCSREGRLQQQRMTSCWLHCLYCGCCSGWR